MSGIGSGISGGGGGFDSTAATVITYTTGLGAVPQLNGPTDQTLEVAANGANSLYLTAGNQVLFNVAGHYTRMGLGFTNLPSDGGLYFTSDSTASTPETMMYRDGAGRVRLTTDILADDTDRQLVFAVKSCNGTNLNCGISFIANHGTNTILSEFGGAFGGNAILNLTSNGCTISLGGASTNCAIDVNTTVTGNFTLTTAGNGLLIKEGANATMGVATLVAGTVVVSTTKVTATSRIFLTSQTSGGTPGFVGVSARTAATSFTITGLATDTSTVAWMIVEPA